MKLIVTTEKASCDRHPGYQAHISRFEFAISGYTYHWLVNPKGKVTSPEQGSKGALLSFQEQIGDRHRMSTSRQW